MSNPTYKLIELTGTSPNSIEEAVESALAKASEDRAATPLVSSG